MAQELEVEQPGALAGMLALPGVVAAQSDAARLPQGPLATLLTPTNFDEPAKERDGGKEKAQTDDKDADKKDDKEEKENGKPAWYTIHAQSTVIAQGDWRFRSPYRGPNSFLPGPSLIETMTGTLFLGIKVWEGGEIYFNPEIAGGSGLSGAFGMGGFTNGEASRVGVPQPTPYIARLYVRQTIGLSGEMEKVEDGVNQIAGERDTHRLIISMGRVPAVRCL